MIKTLKPFQVAGSAFLQEHPHALLADEPGLGKTIQAIDAAEKLKFQTVVVVCPASVREHWKQEIIECIGGEGSPPIYVIMSYEAAVRNHTMLSSFDCLILDEGHFLKTPDSYRTQAIFGNSGKGLARRAQKAIWVLTGTPVLNRPRELYPVLKTLHPGFSEEKFDTYAQRYCGAYFDGYGINTKGASRLDELKGRLNGFMLRRTKAEVLPELPPKIICRIPLNLNNTDKKMIFEAENEIQNREAKISAAAEDFSQLGDIAKLLHITGQAKVHAAALFIEELLETQNKVVVFTRHREVLSQLANRLVKYGPLQYQGGMHDTQKTKVIELFKNDDDCRIFLGNIQAAGIGIDGLQEVCSSVVFVELSWVPGEMSQAIDRLHRIGQGASAVNVYLLHAPGSLESAVLSVQNAKGSVIGRLMGENGWRS